MTRWTISRAGGRLARVGVVVASVALLAALVPAVASATNFATNQNAGLVLGSPGFTSTSRGPNMASGLDRPYGVQLDAAGRVLVGDFGNNRLAVFNAFPGTNGAAPNLVLRNLGGADYRGACSATQGRHVSGAWSAGGRLAVVESTETSLSDWNSRVVLYDAMPGATGAAASRVLGQPNLTTCGSGAPSATTLDRPAAVWTDGTKIIVSDRDHDRVLIWNSWPAVDNAPADLVLGQANMTTSIDDDGIESASTLEKPNGVWSDGTRIVVADTFNNRTLVWTTWPTVNAQPANLVLGQASFTTATSSCGASTTWAPKGIASNGTKLAITDAYARVLLYDTFPVANGAAASRVLGQATMTTCAGHNAGVTMPGATSLGLPYGVTTDGTRLLVADRINHRVLAWTSWPTVDNQVADRVIGHTTFGSVGPNDVAMTQMSYWSYYTDVTSPTTDDPMEPANGGTWPAASPAGDLFISTSKASRLLHWTTWPTTADEPATRYYGQSAGDHAFCNGAAQVVSATSTCYPSGVWTNGTKLAITDSANHRVKLWNTMPTASNQPPDIILGQAATTTRVAGAGPTGMDGPMGVASNGTMLVVTDTWNNRALVWTTWPVATGEAADFALGQPDMATVTSNTGGRGAATLDQPVGASIDDGRLAIADQANNRVLIWDTLPSGQADPADTVYGQATFAAAVTTTLDAPKGVALSDNVLVLAARCDVQVLDPVPVGTVAGGATPVGRGCLSATPSQPNVWQPTGVAVRAGSIWVGNDGNARVTRFDDVTPPLLTRGPAHAVRIGCVASVRVSWTTTESTTTEVHWGPTPTAGFAGYPNHDVDPDITGLLHQRTVVGVGAGTWYYRVRSVNAAGNEVVSGERSFVVGGATPPHDAFGSSIVLPGAGGTRTDSNMGACSEAGEPLHAGLSGGSSVWYSWTAPSTGRWVLDTLGSDVDTLLGVYTGAAVGSLALVASNDDAGGATRQSRIGFNAVSGTTYRIAVDGWHGDSGPITVTLRNVANDAFASATVMTGTIDTESGSTVGATKEAGEPNHAGNVGGASIWFQWTAPTTGDVTIDTLGSDYDTILGAYTGSSVGSLTTIASNDDSFGSGGPSRVTFTATIGTTYRIAVDGWNGASGDVTVHLVQPPTLTLATPATGPQGRRALVVQLTGTAFTASTTVAFSGTGVAVTGVAYVSPTRLDATIDIDDAAPLGLRDVTVANPNSTTATGLFTVTAPAISVGMSTLGYQDVARTPAGPYTIAFGPVLPGAVREIGPAGSGQALAGSAVRLAVTSDTNVDVLVSSTDWTAGANTVAASQMRWKHFGVVEAWTPFTNALANTETLTSPGTITYDYDLRMTVPAAQPTGSYSATVSWTVIASP